MGFQIYGCWDQERAALLLLNASLTNSFGLWKEDDKDSDCCDWFGVTCGKNKRIISLTLTQVFDSEVGWHLNASIFLPFQELRALSLSINKISSWTEVKGSMKLSSKLKHLEELDLGINQLDSSIFLHLSGFQSLKRLYLEGNHLGGVIRIQDMEAISKNLEVLDLSYNQITSFLNHNGCDEPLHRLQNSQLYGKTSCLCGLRSLKMLYLPFNQLVGEIPSWLQNLTSLETLDLRGNQLIGNIGSSSLIHLHSLRDLTVSENHLQIPDTFQSFANHTKLKYFIGDSNQVVNEVTKPIAQPFTLRLEILSLSRCALFTYPSFLHNQQDLMFIDLSDNSLQEFPTWLFEKNLRLDTLILSNNSLTGSFQLPSLRHVYLSRLFIAQNKIQGHIPKNIGVVFPKLVELDLSNNELKGNITSSLDDLESLKGLYLSNNHLSGAIEHLPKNLESLDLSNNDFRGKLPSFNGLLSLRILNLQGNNYSSGLIMNMFGPSIDVLNLSNNSLEGPLPEDICSYFELTVLDLSFNKLNGSLPICSGFLGMGSLYLNNNRFSGQVTDAFCNGTIWLNLLDLSNNDLSGPIPAAIGNLTHLSALVLRGNRFQGQVPLQLCNLLRMVILDLSYNSIHGSIPTCLRQIGTSSRSFSFIGFSSIDFPETVKKGKLGVFIIENSNVAHSSFDNKVEFMTKNMAYSYRGGILDMMSGIDLSCNRLTGQIPHELGNLSNLHALNISHNMLWGSIPATLSDLKNIESLDLSYNQLNGSIPPAVTDSNTLQVFMVAHNNLSGRIPFEAHSSTFDASSYKGNPFLCGPPSSNNCTSGESPSIIRSESKDEDEDGDWIDIEIFYVTFVVSGGIMFLTTVVTIMVISPHWLNACFYLVKSCITFTYYFCVDSMRKLGRARHV